MPNRFEKHAIAACLMLAAVLPAIAAEIGPRSGQWAHEDSTLVPDERVTWGRLDNGFRYAILPHTGVPGRVSLRLIVLAGSLDEKDHERGIAHFTEHMAFRDSRDFTQEDMVAFFQRLGMEYGSDVNAVTTYDHTAYALDYREATAGLLDTGLSLFRNFADGISFKEESIEQERPVILSELRSRDSFTARGQFDSFDTIYQGLELANRSPIGTVESLKRLTRADFREFYQRCYRPDAMILVATGDFRAAKLEAMITEHFATIPPALTPLPERQLGRLTSGKEVRVGLFRVTNLGFAQVVAASPASANGDVDSIELRKEALRQKLALSLLGKRLDSVVLEAANGDAALETIAGNRTAFARIVIDAEQWDPGVRALDQMIRATYERGFDRREVDSLTKDIASYTDHAVGQYATLDPYILGEALTDSIVEHRVYVGYEKDLRWRKQWLAEVDSRSLQRSFQNAWDLERMAYHIVGEVPKKVTAEKVRAQIARSRKGGVRHVRLETRRETAFQLHDWGKPTDAELVREVPELSAELYRFGNNVRLNLVSSHSEPGLAHVTVRVGSGLLDMPGNEPALKEFGLQTLFSSGTTHYRAEELQQIIAERFLDFSFDLEDHDAFTFRGTISNEELPTFLGFVTEFLYKPRFGTYVHRTEKVKAARNRASSEIGMQDGIRKLTDYLFEGDARFELGTISDYVGMSSLAVKSWLERPLTSGYVEATIVGDVETEETLDIVSKTLGSLKTRADEKKTALPPAPVKVTAPPGFNRIEFVGEQHLAAVRATWPVTGNVNGRDEAALHILSKIVEIHIREQIRDNLGLAYGPAARYRSFEGFPNFGVLEATIDCAPSEATRIAQLVEEIAARLSAEGVDDGEFIGSRGILASQVRRAWLDNGFVLSTLVRAQEQPDSIDLLIQLKEGLIDDVSVEEVNQWASRILTARNSRTAAIVPKEFIGIFSTDQF